jgi:C4-dicarboxylate-specific signal transduction histidine kinase
MENFSLIGSLFICLTALAGYLLLFFISRLGYFKFAAYIFIFSFFALTTYYAYSFGAELFTGLLGFILVIIISGILINSRFAFFITLLSSIALILIGYLEINNLIQPNLYWKTEKLKFQESFFFSFSFLVIAIVSWLSNKEIEKSLKRARKSEKELKKERDSLEIRVEERTEELKKTQMEKMSELSRFAEFGRISSGLFHDLVNPLTALSLNLEQVNQGHSTDIKSAKTYLDQSIKTARRMGDLITAVRKQIARQENKAAFSINAEIEEIIELLSYKARKANVEINFTADKNIMTYGDSIKFSQIIMNLSANAIEAYEKASQSIANKTINISLTEKNKRVVLEIEDFGEGISDENMQKIFNPFFTTKDFARGNGIGLSSSKNIIEKDFAGTIAVTSQLNHGTEFVINFPINIK